MSGRKKLAKPIFSPIDGSIFQRFKVQEQKLQSCPSKHWKEENKENEAGNGPFLTKLRPLLLVRCLNARNCNSVMKPLKVHESLWYTISTNHMGLELGTNRAKNRANVGQEPWSSGYGWRLTFWRLWVWIPAPYTGWTFFTLICCKIVLMFV